MQNVRIVRRGFVRSAVALNAFVALLQAGCNSSDSTDANARGTASLEITITSPAGVTPSVTVSGPAGYQQTLTVSQTLSRLAPGEYTVAGEPVFVPHPIVGTVYDATMTVGSAISPKTAVVSISTSATVSVSYAARPGTGALWVGSETGGNPTSSFIATVAAYSATQLAASTSAAPAMAIFTEPEPVVLAGAAVDADGTLWTAMNYDDHVVNQGILESLPKYQFQFLVPAGPPDLYSVIPSVHLTVTSGAREFVKGIAVGSGGTVWVTNYTANAIVEFTPSQFVPEANPSPAVTLTASGGSLSGPSALAFDGAGNLWVANANGNTVVEFAASQLLTSGSPAPAVTLGAAGGSLDGPSALAFAGGNLWIANSDASTLIEFTASQLVSSGTPTPAVTLSANNSSLSAPSSLAFDASGDLWVANASAGTIVEFGANQIAASGAPAPIATVSGSSLSAPRGLVFNPSPLTCAACWDYGLNASVAEQHTHLARAVSNPKAFPSAASPRR